VDKALLLEKRQEFQSWQRKISPLMTLLNKGPGSKFETIVTSGENEVEDDKFLVDPELPNKCRALYEDLLAQVVEKKKEATLLWSDLQGMWSELEEKEEFQLTFTSADAGVIKALKELKAQFVQRKEDLNKRIEVFIGALRKDISDIWTLCMITEEEKAEFREFVSTEFTEATLDVHKAELKKWQIYFKKNQEILNKVKRRELMWTELKELEMKADDPNRFINRGGTLLKDQNLLNSVLKSLPKLEAELIKLADNFEKEHGKKMKIFGKLIPSMVEEDWKNFNEGKAAKKNSHRALPPLPNNTPATAVVNSGALRPLRSSIATRKSLMPPRKKQPETVDSFMRPASSRPAEKRPASRLLGRATPLKVTKFAASLESIRSDQS